MLARFTLCDECGYGVEEGASWCPNCGLYTVADAPGFFDRMFKGAKAGRKRHPESLNALSESLTAELKRIYEDLQQLKRARSPLGERLGQAQSAGRDTRALEDALEELNRAETQAEMLLIRHRGLLKGVALEREHNALRMRMSSLEETGEDAAATPQARVQVEMRGPVTDLQPYATGVIGLSAQGTRLMVWSPNGGLGHLEVPGVSAASLRVSGDTAVLAGGNRVQCWTHGQWSAPLELGRDQVGCVDVLGDRALVGTKGGDLLLLRLPSDPSGRPRQEARIANAHPFGLNGVSLLANGNRALSSGSNHLKSWWVTPSGITPFSQVRMDGCGALHLHPQQHRLVVERGDRVAVWDSGLSELEGELPVRGKGLRWGPDGVRLLVWHHGRVGLASARTRATTHLLEVSGMASAACWHDKELAVVHGSAVLGNWSLSLYPPDAMGLTGWTLAALLELQHVMTTCRPYVPADIKKRVMLDQTLVEQCQGFVADAGHLAVLAVMHRAARIEGLPDSARIPALEQLFSELDDIVAVLKQTESFTFALSQALSKLHRLPTAVLLGQVDQILAQVQELFVGTAGADEDELGRRVDRLEALSRWLDEVIRISNGLKGPFWGTPDRAKLVDALLHLKGELPGLLDAMHASMAAAVLGRVDPLAEDHTLEKLKSQRERVQGIGGVGAHAAEVALHDAVESGPLGQDHAAKDRTERLAHLEDAKRELGAETRAWLELRGDED